MLWHDRNHSIRKKNSSSGLLILLAAFACAQANHTETSAENTAYELIVASLIKAGDDPQNAACLAFILRYSGQIEQNKAIINEHSVDQVIKMIKDESKFSDLLCSLGLTTLAIGFAVFLVLSIVCCCACCCFVAQLCRSSDHAVISGSKKAKMNNKAGDKVEMYSPRSRKQVTDV